MKKIKVALAALGLMVAMTSQASALTMTLTEQFLGTPDDANFWILNMQNKNTATFNFDFKAIGGNGILQNSNNSSTTTVVPTIDETRYNPATWSLINPFLKMDFSDTDNRQEKVDYTVSVLLNNLLAGTRTFTLGGNSNPTTSFLGFDLGNYTNLLQDGTLISVLVTPTFSNNNDIKLESITYTADAFSTTTVPEPGTMVLLGFGMLGLAIYGKRRMNKDA